MVQRLSRPPPDHWMLTAWDNAREKESVAKGSEVTMVPVLGPAAVQVVEDRCTSAL